jgi:hypothetical protein
MMSNHHHGLVYDAHGRDVEFREQFHKMFAKSQNALRGRWENLWASEEPCVVEVLGRDDLHDKLVYIATNPVKDRLVEKVHHWPGPHFTNALLTGRPMNACRPKHFFGEHGAARRRHGARRQDRYHRGRPPQGEDRQQRRFTARGIPGHLQASIGMTRERFASTAFCAAVSSRPLHRGRVAKQLGTTVRPASSSIA